MAAASAQPVSPVSAQTAPNPAVQPASKSPSPEAHTAQAAKHSKHNRAPQPDPQPTVAVAPLPPAPPPPNWPVNDKPKPPAVEWNGRELSIGATNSSLQQILRDVSTATGVKVEGMGADQRIFGSYGPAPARDVLSQLLDGSGYNVLMIGDSGEGTPRQLVLTTKTGTQTQAANAQPRQSSDDEVQEDPEPPPEQPEPVQRRPAGVVPNQPGQPGQVRSPQEQLQEMQQMRQQQLQQMQQQQQQPNNPQPPNE